MGQTKQADILGDFLRDGRTTRRQFLSTAAAFGVSLGAASSLWSQAAKAAPQTGGHLRIGVAGGATSDSLNPATYNDTYMIIVGFSTRDNLTEIAPDNSLRGGLAESWDVNDDATQWSFNLRQGVEFSNGKTLDAEDVITSLNLHRGPDTISGASGVTAAIKDIIADGKNRVIFTLDSANADFPYILTDYHLNIVPAKDGKAHWQGGIGTGAYLLEEFEPGVRSTFKLNPNRWQQDTGYVETAELLMINDTNARQNAVTTGEIDAMNRVDVKTAELLGRSPNVSILDVPGRLHHNMPMNTKFEPFNNVDVRLALKYAINREEYVQKVLRGFAQVGNDNPIGPAFRFYSPDIPQREYDPDKAKFHLKKAGMESLSVDLSTSDGGAFPGAVDAAVLYHEAAKKAGIDINVVREPADGYSTNVWMNKPWCMIYWGARPIEDMVLSLNYLSNANWNDYFIKDEQLDKLIIGARGELDNSRRAEMYHDIALRIRDEGGALIPAFANMVHGLGAQVGKIEHTGGSWEMDGGHCIKRWWLT